MSDCAQAVALQLSSLEPSNDSFAGFMDAETATFASRIRRLIRSKVEELQSSLPGTDSGKQACHRTGHLHGTLQCNAGFQGAKTDTLHYVVLQCLWAGMSVPNRHCTSKLATSADIASNNTASSYLSTHLTDARLSI